MTYFRTGCRTIIGAVSFHGPVRDGKGWFQDAMAARQRGWLAGTTERARGRDSEVAVKCSVRVEDCRAGVTRWLSVAEVTAAQDLLPAGVICANPKL